MLSLIIFLRREAWSWENLEIAEVVDVLHVHFSSWNEVVLKLKLYVCGPLTGMAVVVENSDPN